MALVVLGVSSLAWAQEAKLEWKFEKDKPFYQEVSTETKQSMTVMGMNITQNQKQTFYFSWTPREQDANKNWVLTQKIEGVKMDIEIGGNKINYDSTTKETPTGNPLADFFKALIGSEFKLTLSPELKVIKVEGRDDFVKKLTNANAAMKPLLEQILSEEALKQMADPTFAAVPGKPVKKGDSWKKESKLNMGPIGTYDLTYTYTYEGKEKELDKIKVDTALKYLPPGDNVMGLPFRIKEADLKSKDATGTIQFDGAKGRLDSSDMSLKLDGTLSIDIGGQTTKVELSQTQNTKVKTTDTNPVKK
jgi:hypothetical protein